MDNKNQLIITVAGRSATGKTTIANLIAKALKLYGFNPEIVLGLDHNNEEDFYVDGNKNFNDKIKSMLKKDTAIKIKEKQIIFDFNDNSWREK